MGGYVADQGPDEAPLAAAIPGYEKDPAAAPNWASAIGDLAGTAAGSYFQLLKQQGEVSEFEHPTDQTDVSQINEGGLDFPTMKAPKTLSPDYGPSVPKGDLDKQLAPAGEHWFDRDMPLPVAQLIAKQKTQDAERMAGWQRFTNAHSWPTNFLAGTAAFIMDPSQAATLFVPGLGEEVAMSAMARIGLGQGIAARMGARALSGATGATAGLVPLEAARAAADPDWNLRQSFGDMAFNAALGAVLHSGMGLGRELGVLKPDELITDYWKRRADALGTPETAAPEIAPPTTADLAGGSTALGIAPIPAAVEHPRIAEEAKTVMTADADTQHAAISAAISKVIHGEEMDTSPIYRESFARTIDPEAFVTWDRLQDTETRLRTWMLDAQEARASGETIPGITGELQRIDAQVEAITAKVPNLNKLTNRARDRLEALQADRDQLRQQATTQDTADMTRIRQRIMETDFKQRDLAERISAAYRQAEQMLGMNPVAGSVETPAQLAQRQQTLHREGVTSGLTQGQVREQNEAIYGERSKERGARTGKRGAADRKAAAAGAGGPDAGAAEKGPAGGVPRQAPGAEPGAVPAGGPRAGEVEPQRPLTATNAELPEIQRHGTEAGKVLAHDPAIEAILSQPEVQAAVNRPRAIDRSKRVPYLAGSNKEGGVTYIDASVPHELQIGDKIVDPAKYLNVHEQVEHALMVEGGMPYETAHRVATAHEQAAVEADGVDWATYQQEMHKLAGSTEKAKIEDTPSDLFMKGVYPAEEAATIAAAAKPTKTFTTAKGSTYETTPKGTTKRNKAFRAEHGIEQQGPMPESEQTFYVSNEDAVKLAEIQAQGGPAKIIAPLGDGRFGVKYVSGKDAGKFERRTVVTPRLSPEVGLTPVETWKGGKSVHFGNEITEVGEAKPAAASPAEVETTTRKRKAQPPKRPLSMAEYIAWNGGMEATPDAKAAGLDKHLVPGAGRLARRSGRPLDYWRERLQEEGFIRPDDPDLPARDTHPEIYEALDTEIRHKRPTFALAAADEMAKRGEEARVAHDPDQKEHYENTIADLVDEVRARAHEHGITRPKDSILRAAAEMMFHDPTIHPVDAVERAFEQEGHERGHPVQHHYNEIPEEWQDEAYGGAASEHGALPGEEGEGGAPPRPQAGSGGAGEDRAGAVEGSRFGGGDAGGFQEEPGAEGLPQSLIPGVAPLQKPQGTPATGLKLEPYVPPGAQAARPPQAPQMPAGGLFDELRQQQTDLLDAIAKAEQSLRDLAGSGVTLDRESHALLAAADLKVADAERDAEAYMQAGSCLEEGA